MAVNGSVLATLATSANPLHADMVVKDFGQTILRYMEGGSAPMFAMLSAMQTATAQNVEHGYYGKGNILPKVKATVAAIAGDTTITSDDTSKIIKGMILQVPTTGENLLVTSVVSGTSFTATRGFGTVAAGAIALNEILIQIGNAYEEAATRAPSYSWNPVQFKNWTQIFRNGWAVSGSASAIQNIVGEGQVSENKRDCMWLHSSDIEKSILFGQKKNTTLNGKPIRTMEGIRYNVADLTNYPDAYAAVNVFAAGATTNWSQLEAMLELTLNQQMAESTQSKRTMFCGSKAIQVINNICRLNGQMELMTRQSNFGIQVRTLYTARGEFNIIEHPLLNMNPAWAAMAFVVDLNAFRLAYLGDRKTREINYNYAGNGQLKPVDTGLDAVGGELLTEVTIEHRNTAGNAVITGFTAAAAG